ncbi:FecR family protein [Hoeflea prorocentri]|uniref:FecR domain-containing protein n=1 Tax=Hoeflea prorocentri TaxID=1922333 RepID=A0A9X3ZII2_9HYPH|nr:FecR domain-containing protein [Hoeflea prorocentri]MCY6382469.1 FecR domain-containing protein [Hoeflea prorocentri]MDA5400269.1 FecR domain-containing protein [Hoeflea prorocentri]
MRSLFAGHPNRRRVLAGLSVAVSGMLLPSRLLAADAIGEVTALTGEATAERGKEPVALRIGADVMVRDLIKTGNQSFLAMRLGDETDMRLGEDAELLIDEYLLDIGGTFDLSNGAMVFDRPESAPKTATTIRTVFGQLGVRGTRFFAGPSNGVFGVFVERGALSVTAAGATQLLSSGDGVDIPAPGAPASDIIRWSDERIASAFASVEPR